MPAAATRDFLLCLAENPKFTTVHFRYHYQASSAKPAIDILIEEGDFPRQSAYFTCSKTGIQQEGTCSHTPPVGMAPTPHENVLWEA